MISSYLFIHWSYLLIALFVLGVVTSIVTELFKPYVKKIMPVELFVIIVAVVLSVVMYLAFTSYLVCIIVWYEVVASATLGLVIAFITMNGWDTFGAILKKYKVLLSGK